jgi:hypothetical protein
MGHGDRPALQVDVVPGEAERFQRRIPVIGIIHHNASSPSSSTWSMNDRSSSAQPSVLARSPKSGHEGGEARQPGA